MTRRFMNFTDDDFVIIEDMRERGFTYDQIGRGFDCSGHAISWHCLRQGIEGKRIGPTVKPAKTSKSIARGNHIVRPFTEAEDAVLRKMSEAGAKISRMAHKLGRRHNSIVGRLATIARHDARGEAASGKV